MAPGVESYSFGEITIDGATDGVRENWWRRKGHSLHPEDVRQVLEEVKPDVLIVGCGASGALTVPGETREWIEARGTKVLDLPSREAVEKYNEMASRVNVVAALHLTC